MKYLQETFDSALKIRKFQLEINNKMIAGELDFPIHLAIGAELLVASIMLLRDSISGIFLTHRNIPFSLYFAEKAEDYIKYLKHPKNKLASMNSSKFDEIIKYSSSILGNNLSVAAGFAYSCTKQIKNKIVIADTGDGAIEEGVFWETLIMARHFNLPILILVQDNDQSMYTRQSERRKVIDMKLIADAHGINFVNLDNRGVDTFEKVDHALKLALEGPTILNVNVPIFNHHHGPTPGFQGDEFHISTNNQGLIEKLSENYYVDPLLRILKIGLVKINNEDNS